ncbi:MAG: hypothetical protein PHW04_00110 [Candidatus Wallbacteria bacterium]|nr:hypothetical protein [Candidatus Wallbacteria bacterium]
MDHGSYREAIPLLKRVQALDPDIPYTYYCLGKCNQELSELTASIGFYRKFLELVTGGEERKILTPGREQWKFTIWKRLGNILILKHDLQTEEESVVGREFNVWRSTRPAENPLNGEFTDWKPAFNVGRVKVQEVGKKILEAEIISEESPLNVGDYILLDKSQGGKSR